MFIPAGSIVDGWAFVGANTRLGDIVRTGPVTGELWSISMKGSWISADDAYELFETTERVFCTRLRCEIEINPVIPFSPTVDQYQLKPKE